MTDLDDLRDGLYTMKIVCRLTGLSPDTIRVWERRYQAVTPPRTTGQTRRFTAQEVRRLILLKHATKRGHRIKNIAKLDEKALAQLLEQESGLLTLGKNQQNALSPSKDLERLQQDYLNAVERFEIDQAQGLLSRAALLLDRRAFLFDLVLPILRETGNRWHRQQYSVAHEHVVSTQIRALLDTFARLTSPHPGAPKILVTTPSGQLHEFGALMGALVAASRGFHALYLGPNLPEQDLLVAIDLSRARLLLLGLLKDMSTKELESFKTTLEHLTQRIEVWIGLPPHHPVHSMSDKMRFFTCFEDLDAALTNRIA